MTKRKNLIFLFLFETLLGWSTSVDIPNGLVEQHSNHTNDENFAPNRFEGSGAALYIVGGNEISISKVPYLIAIRIKFKKGSSTRCGGSLLTPSLVLTAAHCLETYAAYTCRAGSTNYFTGGQLKRAKLAIRHEHYNEPSHYYNDIGLLKVESPFQLGADVKLIRLPDPNAKLPDKFYIAGWGATSENGVVPKDDNLLGLVLNIQDKETCRKQYKPLEMDVNDKMFCTFNPGQDACQGDSGGPLVHAGVQYGIVSFGMGCARKNYSGVFTDVRKMLDWIKEITSSLEIEKEEEQET